MMGEMQGIRQERFERLFREHADAVYRYAVRRDAQAADDVVAEVFLVAWRRLDDVPAGAELPWLLGVARRTQANARRSSRRQTALAHRLEHEVEPAAQPATELGDTKLHAALACLPARDQEVLMLVAWEGLDHSGVGQVMGCSRANVAVRLHRARRRLARELERLDGAPAGLTAPVEEARNA
jgi:RNA polymerase sigma-70 factor, ECF subfamily